MNHMNRCYFPPTIMTWRFIGSRKNKSNVYEHDSCTVYEKRKKISTKKKCIVDKLFSISFQFIWRVLPSGSSWNVSRVVSDSLLPHEPAVGCLLSAGARSRLSTQQLPLFHSLTLSLSLGSLPDACTAHTSAVLGPLQRGSPREVTCRPHSLSSWKRPARLYLSCRDLNDRGVGWLERWNI